MRRPLFTLLALLPSMPAVVQAQAPLPADTAVHTGRLPNGLTYFIRRNGYPEHRLELRLVVRAGSILEDDDQRGLAHFVEHMAFNGTTHFQRNDLIKYLESIGVRFGADLNASTSFDETTYILPVPSDKPDQVARAFDILQDWAEGVRFDSMEVVNERGVVLGEWRSGLGASSRIRDHEFPILFQGSRYATRLPIGDTGTIAHAEPAPIKRFYRDWYRPDLMAVIAVGDFPVDQTLALIKGRLGTIKPRAQERPRLVADVPTIPGTRVSITTDPELTNASVELLIRRPARTYRTEADERTNLIYSLFSSIAGQRMNELSRKPETPFVSVFFGPTSLVRDVDIFAVSTTGKEGKVAQAFEAVLRELRRFDAHGVLPAELERAKADLLRGREQAAAEANKTPSASYVGQLLGTYLEGNVAVSAGDRLALAQRLLPTITVAEVNAAIRDASRGTDRFIALRGPDGQATTLPGRDSLLAIIARTDTATLAPWTETVVAGPLVPTPPAGGRIVSETTDSVLGVTDWRLSNGVRVLIKPTDFKADQIVLSGSGLGGNSLLGTDDLVSGAFATQIVATGGIGQFDAPTLRKRLAGKVANVIPVIDETSQGVLGITAPKDLETFFPVLWLTLTEPRLDTTAIAAVVSSVRSQLANRDKDPKTALQDTITITMGQNSPRAQPFTAAQLDQLDPARALAIYRERYADFGEWTFEIVGAVTPDSLRPLVTQWLGSLPNLGTHQHWRDVGPRPPEGVLTKVIRQGKEPVATQYIFFTGPAVATGPAERQEAEAAAQILETRLTDRLREAMGATYGVSASSQVSVLPHKDYTTVIEFTSKPEQADTLWVAAQQVVTDLQEKGPTSDELQKYVEQERRSTEVAVKTNFWWLSAISQQIEWEEPLRDILAWGARLDSLTIEQVRDAARRYLDPSRVARFVLLPEIPAASEGGN